MKLQTDIFERSHTLYVWEMFYLTKNEKDGSKQRVLLRAIFFNMRTWVKFADYTFFYTYNMWPQSFILIMEMHRLPLERSETNKNFTHIYIEKAWNLKIQIEFLSLYMCSNFKEVSGEKTNFCSPDFIGYVADRILRNAEILVFLTFVQYPRR